MTSVIYDLGKVRGGLTVLGFYESYAALCAAVTQPEAGDAYGVGAAIPYQIYVWNGAAAQWKNIGTLQGEPGTPGAAGPQGPAGPAGADGAPGPAGEGFRILGRYESLAGLAQAVSGPQPGDAYAVGAAAPYAIYLWDGVGLDWVNLGAIQGLDGADGTDGVDGGYYTPEVDDEGYLNWTPSKTGMAAVPSAYVRGVDGAPGARGPAGGYYTPAVDSSGTLRWTGSQVGMSAVPSASIRGPAGPSGTPGANGMDGADGGYYTPEVDNEGYLSWTPSKAGMETVPSAYVRGLDGAPGAPGARGPAGGYYTPAVDSSGTLLWTGSQTGMAAVPSANIQGPAGPNLVNTDTDTTLSGLLKGNGAKISAAVAGTDYQTPLAAATASPQMDGTAAAGSSAAYARGDHVHPTDSSRLAANRLGAANGAASLNGESKVSPSQASADLVEVSTGLTLGLVHAGCLLRVNAATALILTVPTNAGAAFPIDTEIEVMRYGAGAVTIKAAAGVTVNGLSGTAVSFSLGNQYTGVVLKKQGTNTWTVQGAME